MADSTPICRCRVLYLGSAVPRQSKDGLQGIQEPLRSLYPSEGAVGAKGIDSWLSVWSNGILLENVDENLKQITRFFPIESLHYCAAVRQVLIPERGASSPEPKFLPLDSPFARMPRAQHPPIFAAILRRTTGIKVLECHVFICKREAAANALVRCCFHAYADNSYARQLETSSTLGGGGGGSVYGTLKSAAGTKSNGDLSSVGLANGAHYHHHAQQQPHGPPSSQGGWRSRAGSTATLNSVGRHSNGHVANGGVATLSINGGADSASSAAEGYTSVKNFYGSSADLNVTVDDGDGDGDGDASVYNGGDENHKVWSGSHDQLDSVGLESAYDVCSGHASTLGRPARLRQISVPIDVPPPPAKDDAARRKKDRKSSKSSGSQSLSGTLIRPKPIHPAALQRPALHLGGPEAVAYGAAAAARHYHTIGGHRGFPPGPPGPMPMAMPMPMSMPMPHAPHPRTHPHPHPHPHPQMMHPAAHVGVHPLQVPLLMPQQFATLQPSSSTKKKKKEKRGAGIPVGMPIVPPLYAYQHPSMGAASLQAPHSLLGEPRPLSRSSRRLAASVGNGLDDSGASGAESPGGTGTGIYRRKGHLNERAFSYSIRQEHRSRSHGSLASLQFNPPDMKKEREIAQMVAGLDLDDGPDEQRPPPLQRKQPAPPLSNGAAAAAAHHHALYGHGGAGGSGLSSSFGKPRR